MDQIIYLIFDLEVLYMNGQTKFKRGLLPPVAFINCFLLYTEQ